jgi:AcrR family transcriptional regulator
MNALSETEYRPTRRDRNRRANIAEIKTRASRQLAESGPGGLNLRAIAREMGMAPSALYRYYASAGDLIGELCADAFDQAADTISAAGDDLDEHDHPGRWWAMCHALRDWTQDYPAEFALIFGPPQPGYHASPEVTGPASGRFTRVPLDIYAASVSEGAADPTRTEVGTDIGIGELLPILLTDSADYPPQLAGIALNAAAGVLGFLSLETFGSLARLIDNTDTLYRSHLRTIMLGMGYNPDHMRHLGA